MRPENRIDIFCDILKREWLKSPDLRFTQFLFNHGIYNTDSQYGLEEPEVLNLMFPDVDKAEYTLWRTYGKDKNQYQIKTIKELDTNHIKNILKTEKISGYYKKVLEDELKKRE